MEHQFCFLAALSHQLFQPGFPGGYDGNLRHGKESIQKNEKNKNKNLFGHNLAKIQKINGSNKLLSITSFKYLKEE
jgi:hypothetical protein